MTRDHQVAAAVLAVLVLCALPRRLAGAQERMELPPLPSGHSLDVAGSIGPEDTLARTAMIRAELEVIRLFMGRPSAAPSRLRVRDAQPRVVLRQAHALFERANILSLEVTRTVGRDLSESAGGSAGASDVLRVLDRVLERVLTVKRSLGIATGAPDVPLRGDATPIQVFHAVTQATVELDQLARRTTTPSEVFRLVTAAVHQMAAVLVSVPGARLPDEPEFEPNRTPDDVYLRLRECHDLLRRVAERRQLDVVVIASDSTEVTPIDVSEVAGILLAETEYLRSAWPGALLPRRAYHPGTRYPSHVYQRAGLLSRILQDVLERSPARSTE